VQSVCAHKRWCRLYRGWGSFVGLLAVSSEVSTSLSASRASCSQSDGLAERLADRGAEIGVGSGEWAVMQQVVGLTWLRCMQGLQGCYMQDSSVGATSRQQQRKRTEGPGAAAYTGAGSGAGVTVVCRRVCGAVPGKQGLWMRLCAWMCASALAASTGKTNKAKG
jgi:hypothetical protein